MDFVGVNRRQNESGVLRGGKFFRGLFLTEVVGLTVITTTFAEDLQSIYNFSGICDREYHGSQGASRWFCKIYCGKAVIVRLILKISSEHLAILHKIWYIHYTKHCTDERITVQ